MEESEGSGLTPHNPVTGSVCPHLTVMGWSGRAAQTHLTGQQLSDGFSEWASSPVAAKAGASLCAVSFCLADVDECEDPAVQCLWGDCRNTPGSYECHCQAGFQLINGTACEGTNPIPAVLWVQDIQPPYISPSFLTRRVPVLRQVMPTCIAHP